MADYNAFGLIDRQELLDFTQTLTVQRPTMGSALFPDRKVQYITEEYERMMKNGTLPMMADVHAFDTEANIAERLTWDKVQNEQLLIKKKINQTETLRKKMRQLNDSEIKNFVFDDAENLFNMVLARVEKAKMDALSLGKYPIKENNLDLEIDYGIAQENFVKSWWDENADILGDIVKWTDQAEEEGTRPNTMIASRKVFRILQKNAGVQTAIYGGTNVGRLPSMTEINGLLQDSAQVSILLNDEHYGEPKYDGTKITMQRKRFWPEDTVVFVNRTNGRVGEGLWGVTPEEEAITGTFQMLSERQFVTITQWASEDPVNVWTKASGLFVPVLPDVYGHIIANVADVSSKPEAVLTGVKLPLSIENGGTGASDAAGARTALGLGDIATETAPLSLEKGGTGASDAANARTNLDVYDKSEVDGKVAG